jgi:hypothetical protein
MREGRSGDEPALGGQGRDLAPRDELAPDDASPMISRLGPEMASFARPAYLSGDLNTLARRLDKSGIEQFDQALTRQTLYLLENAPKWHLAVQRIRRRLRKDTTIWQRSSTALLAAAQIDNILLAVPASEQEHNHLLHTLLIGIAKFGYRDPMIYEFDPDDTSGSPWVIWEEPWRVHMPGVRHRVWSAHHWQVEATWSILTLHELPPFDETARRSQPHRYQSHDLFVLTRMMTAQQRHDLRHAVIMHALWLFDQHPPARELTRGERSRVRVVREWVRYRSLSNSIIQRTESWYPTGLELPENFYRLSQWAQARALGDATLLLRSLTAGNIGFMLSYVLRMEAVQHAVESTRRWHFEAAWAIVQRGSLPPLE